MHIPTACNFWLVFLLVFMVLCNQDSHAVTIQSKNYHIIVFKAGLPDREFPGTIRIDGPIIKIVSETSRTILLEPLNVNDLNKIILSGKYKLILERQNGKKNIYSANVTVKKGFINIKTDNLVTINLMMVTANNKHKLAKDWFGPLHPYRKRLGEIRKRIVGYFGDYRTSTKRGHKHAGIDLRAGWNEPVYPIANGQVVFVSHRDMNSVVLIKHWITNENVIFSKYVHVKGKKVQLFDFVNENTTLGRSFNKMEFRRSGYKANHIHLEIRKNYSDKGRASSYSMNLRELKRFCYDPIVFFKKYL